MKSADPQRAYDGCCFIVVSVTGLDGWKLTDILTLTVQFRTLAVEHARPLWLLLLLLLSLCSVHVEVFTSLAQTSPCLFDC